MSSTNYKDFDMSFKRHPITGDIGTKSGTEAIKSAIRNLIKTAPYDRKFHPEISCRIKSILFRDISFMTIRSLKLMIEETLKNYEQRINVINVAVKADESLTQYQVTIYFKILNVSEPVSVSTILRRIR